jgi:hypothetical protein
MDPPKFLEEVDLRTKYTYNVSSVEFEEFGHPPKCQQRMQDEEFRQSFVGAYLMRDAYSPAFVSNENSV